MNIIQIVSPLSFVDRYHVPPDAVRVIVELSLPIELIALIVSYTFEKKRYGYQKELMDFVSCRVCHVRLDFESRDFHEYGSMFFYDLNYFIENSQQYRSMAMTRQSITQVCRHCSPRYPNGKYTVFTNVETVSGCSCPLCTTYANMWWLELKDIE